MDEKKVKKIEGEARKILDDFGKALGRVKVKEESLKGEKENWRDEGNGEKADEEFRKMMFNNASDKSEDCIVAEKKW
tara:strand:- start:882 stop:1112 length:231 start_codon:yes stop_codon:yes gene_type:complete